MILPLTIFSSSLKNIRSDPLFSPVPLHSQGQVRMASTVVNADNLSPSLSGSYKAEICSGNVLQHCELFSLAEAKASQLVHGGISRAPEDTNPAPRAGGWGQLSYGNIIKILAARHCLRDCILVKAGQSKDE